MLAWQERVAPIHRQLKLKQRAPSREEAERLTRDRPEFDSITERVAHDIFRCWNDCGPNRQLGFGATGCIPRDAVIAWCRWEGLDRESIEIYWAVIQRLDADRIDREETERRLKKK